MRVITSLYEFDQLITSCEVDRKILVVEFFATWCRPCVQFAPLYDQLASIYDSAELIFVKVDVDQCNHLSNREGIKTIPTCNIYKKSRMVRSIKTSRNIGMLVAAINQIWMDESCQNINSHPRNALFHYARSNLLLVAEEALIKTMHKQLYELPLSNPIFEKYFFIFPGCMQFLFNIGFQESDESLVLSPVADPRRIESFMRQLKWPQMKATVNRNEVLSRLDSYRRQVLVYRDPEAQKEACLVVPSETLLIAASTEERCSVDEVKPSVFLKHFLRWFKDDFFSWVDALTCEECDTKMASSSGTPTPEERSSGNAERVEVYTCPTNPAHRQLRFPRYNNPRKLLQTRRGRCGEWANCIAFILSSLKKSDDSYWFPGVRFVVDFTDHVWCEVWINDFDSGCGRWVHADGECLIDAPLVYEAGWKKKLSYIFAVTVPPIECSTSLQAVDVQDVSWRYTTDYKAMKSRRLFIDEQNLANYLSKLHTRAVRTWQLAGVTQAPFNMTTQLDELIEFLEPSKVDPVAHPEVLRGRKTGSVEWRMARGEMGSGEAAESVSISAWDGESSDIKPTDSELDSACIYLRYNSAVDVYARPFADTKSPPSSTQPETNQPARCSNAGIAGVNTTYSKGWQSMASRWKNVARKRESDWHMTYLARTEGSSEEGIIEWTVDLTNTKFCISEVTVFASMVSFDEVGNNKVAFELCSGDACQRVTPGSEPLVASKEFVGAKNLRLTARLWTSGDTKSDLDWQKSQIFRQKEKDTQSWPFEWKITLIPDT